MFRVTVLAIIAGYADTIGYLHLNAFAGLMTGNTILMGIELATAKYRQAAFHGAIIAMFLFGVIFGRIIVRAGLEVVITQGVERGDRQWSGRDRAEYGSEGARAGLEAGC